MDAVGSFFKELLLSFIPIFVAVDAIGILPIILGLAEAMDKREQSRMLRYAMLTALGLGLGFVALGKLILNVLGISQSHFLVAGGLILMLLASRNLLIGERREASSPADRETMGVFPIGIPLVVGPAVLTTLLVLIDRYPVAPVLLAFVVNLAAAWLILSQSARIARLLGKGGLGAASKIAMLLLAAIAVRMIHRGVVQLIENGTSLL
ncbi:MAG: MarC family protein [Dehalococcoidia bacterium]|nr:MarC family protein [Dehalococcoidia bacterium]